jgi:hypothetical protein
MMILADFGDFLGSLWFAALLGALGFVAGWYLCKKHGHKL